MQAFTFTYNYTSMKTCMYVHVCVRVHVCLSTRPKPRLTLSSASSKKYSHMFTIVYVYPYMYMYTYRWLGVCVYGMDVCRCIAIYRYVHVDIPPSGGWRGCRDAHTLHCSEIQICNFEIHDSRHTLQCSNKHRELPYFLHCIYHIYGWAECLVRFRMRSTVMPTI